MDEGFKSINEIISGHKDDQVRQDDIAWSCLEGELYGDQKIQECDIFSNQKNEVLKNIVYQESEYYDPLQSA